jgi:hypothetical protein
VGYLSADPVTQRNVGCDDDRRSNQWTAYGPLAADVNVRVVGAAIEVDTPVHDEAIVLRGARRTRSRQLMALQA